MDMRDELNYWLPNVNLLQNFAFNKLTYSWVIF